MPTIVFTVGEVASAALDDARQLSTKILKLADVETTPLVPGETPDTRRHQIAKLGKQLAEVFLALDKIMQAVAEAHSSDITAGPVKPPDNSETN